MVKNADGEDRVVKCKVCHKEKMVKEADLTVGWAEQGYVCFRCQPEYDHRNAQEKAQTDFEVLCKKAMADAYILQGLFDAIARGPEQFETILGGDIVSLGLRMQQRLELFMHYQQYIDARREGDLQNKKCEEKTALFKQIGVMVDAAIAKGGKK